MYEKPYHPEIAAIAPQLGFDPGSARAGEIAMSAATQLNMTAIAAKARAAGNRKFIVESLAPAGPRMKARPVALPIAKRLRRA